MNLDLKLSCDDLKPTDTSSSLKHGLDYPIPTVNPPCVEQKCPSVILSSSSSTLCSDVFDKECRIPKVPQPDAPNLGYELALAKSMLQQFSTISGDNL